MSGSGGGGGGDFRSVPEGGAGGDTDRCAITERATLNSPVAAVISTLSVGDPLIVELIEGLAPRIVINTVGGLTAGSLTSRLLVTFIECIRGGYNYSARVLSISGGLVEIEISPA